jgi:hypothetical protein
MAFSFGVWNPQPWSGKIPKRVINQSALLAIARSSGGQFRTMKTRTETGPLWADMDVRAYGRLEQIDLQSPTAGEISLRARKVEGMAQIAEEDLAEGGNYDYDILENLRETAASNTAIYFDNSGIGTSGAATTGETNIIRPYRSIYTTVREDAPDNYVTVAKAANAAAYRSAIKDLIETAEQSDWFDGDLVITASLAWKSYLRDLPIDGSNGAPLWDQNQDTIYGHRIHWSRGARLASAAGAGTATSKPTGNHLMTIGPRALHIAGSAPFKVGNPAVPQVFLTDPTTGLGMRDDSLYFKIRCQLAFAVGDALDEGTTTSAFGVLEQLA